MNLYFISGLGADKSAFSRIHLPEAKMFHVEWVPHAASDTLQSYVQKLLPQINTQEPFVIVGLSFGGIVAQELTRWIQPRKIILISSVTHHRQFPWFYALGHWLVPLMSDRFFTRTNRLVNYLFGASGKNTKVLDAIMRANDPRFIKWCVHQLLRWRNREVPVPLVTIHGAADKIIPYHACDYTIAKGSHFMVYSRASEIQAIIQREISLLLTHD